jgi:hypothetical protein
MSKSGSKSEKPDREARLAEALRANLRRRKAPRGVEEDAKEAEKKSGGPDKTGSSP